MTEQSLDEALERLEDGPLARQLTDATEGLQMPHGAAQRLQSRLDTTLAASNRQNPARSFRLPFTVNRLPRFAMALGVLLVVALAALALGGGLNAPTVSAAELIGKAEQRGAGVIVEPGKVRHIAREVHTAMPNGSDDVRTEIWMMQGKEHLLTHWTIKDSFNGGPYATTLEQVIDNQDVWTLDPSSNTVYTGPFAECSLDLPQWLGDKSFLADAKNDPDARVVGSEKIDGTNTEVVETSFGKLWIVPETGLLLQAEINQTIDGKTYIARDRLTTDEVLDAGSVAADLFQFSIPKGATVNKQSDPMCSNG